MLNSNNCNLGNILLRNPQIRARGSCGNYGSNKEREADWREEKRDNANMKIIHIP